MWLVSSVRVQDEYARACNAIVESTEVVWETKIQVQWFLLLSFKADFVDCALCGISWRLVV